MMSSAIENEHGSIYLNPQDNQMNMPKINSETLIDKLSLAAKVISDVDNLCAQKSKLTVNNCSVDLNEGAKHSLKWPPNLASEVKDAIMLGISSQPMFDDIINQHDSLSNEVGGIAMFVKEVVKNQLADSKDKKVNFNILKDIVKNIK